MLRFSSNRQNGFLGLAVMISAVVCATDVCAMDRRLDPMPMPLGDAVPAPTGFLDFCRRSPSDCATPDEAQADLKTVSARASRLYWAVVFGSGVDSAEDFSQSPPVDTLKSRPVVASVVVMDSDDWKILAQVNRTLNRTIRYSTDERQHGVVDYWDVPTGPDPRGDCDDYVLAKRRALIEAGFPARALSIALVETGLGENHAVLLVSTDTGEFVLDNKTSRILRWDRAGYKWRE